MRIGILGGSFDPVHRGHLTLARESEKQFQLQKILFIPAYLPPHKIHGAGLPVADARHRARMVELAIQGEPHWELCDLELRRSGVSYTVETLRELRRLYPAPHELFFIVGADSFQDLLHWKDPEEILKLCEWIVAPRPTFALPKKLPSRFHLLQMTPLTVSATELREKIERGEDTSDWIPDSVAAYMAREKVYRRNS